MRKRIILIVLLLFLLLFPLHEVISLECEQISDKGQKVSCLEQKLRDLSQAANTLNSEIDLMDTQISLTTSRIQQTEQQIEITTKEIDILGSRIEGLDTSLNYLSKSLVERITQGYKQRSVSLFTILFDSNSATNLFYHIKYLKTAQDNNQKILVQVQEAKLNFEEQKKLREEKKVELDELEKQLNAQKNSLNYQKSQKELILRDTQNDNTRYRILLQQAQSEFNAIQQAIITGSKVGPVKKGDPIALIGNSGAPNCSTGAHLHFEVRQNNSWVNAENYLTPRTVEDRQNNSNSTIGNGSWDWPIQDPIVLEQHYGNTPWSWRYKYSGGIHTGIDIWSRSSDVIRAPADGILYTSSQNCSGPIINIKYIEHNDGLVSFYLHVQ